MSDSIYMLTLAFGVYIFFSIFYQNAARPMLCDRARFRLFALRDKLRRMAIEGIVDASSFQYRYLEKLLCRLVEKCSWFSWTSLLEFAWHNMDAEPSPDSVKFEAEASDPLKMLYTEAVMEMMKVMFTNSPIWTAFIALVICFAQIFGWAWKQWLDIKTKIFLEELSVEGGMLPA